MPIRVVFLVAACACIAAADQGVVRFPYRANIEARRADVYSGPGEDAYPTGLLRRGDEVEVYRHEPGGWCAIRPPLGSFSWVPADAVKLTGDDLAEVIVDDVAALVGSSLHEVRDASHVNLQRGEKVSILGSSNTNSEKWYKISPPAGEFRWINLRDLLDDGDREPYTVQPRTRRSANRRLLERSRWLAASTQTLTEEPSSNPTAYESIFQQNARQDSSDGNYRPSEPVFTDIANDEPRTGWVRPDVRLRRAGETRSQRSQHDRSDGFQGPRNRHGGFVVSGLDSIDLDLSKMVCRPQEQWSFDVLRNRTKDVLREAARPSERGRARRLLDRIARFEDVQRQSLGRGNRIAADRRRFRPIKFHRVQQQKAPIERPGPEVDHRSPHSGVTSDEDSRFDGVGRLIPLQKRRANDPHYLLVDKNGETKYFVTPAPGINLRSYRDRLIGITGSRVEDRALGKPHITAHRVKLLSQQMTWQR